MSLYTEMLEKYEELIKVASKEDLEKEAEAILKEAGIVLPLAKNTAKMVGKVTKGVGKVGSKAGQYAMKNKGKTVGGILTGSYIANSANDAMKKEIKKMKTSNIIEDIDRPKNRYGEKLAAYKNNNNNNNRRNTSKNNDDESGKYKYLPHAAGGAMLGLAIAEGVKSKSVTQPLKTMGVGSVEALQRLIKQKGKKNRIFRILSNAARKASNVISDGDAKIVEWHKKYHSVPHWKKLSDEEMIGIIRNYRNKYGNKGPALEGQPMFDFKKAKQRIKDNSPSLKELNKGLGAGATFGLANFMVHSAGDEYFKRKDADELRRRLRESYEDDVSDIKTMKKLITNPGSVTKNTYKTPKQKAEEIRKRREKRANEIIDGIMKEAISKSKFGQKAKEILKEDVLKNMKRSALFFGTVSAANNLTGRRLNSDFSKINDPNDNLTADGRVIIEVPLTQSGRPSRRARPRKLAFEEIDGIIKEAKFNKKKFVKFKKIITEGTGSAGRQALGALTFAMTPAIFQSLTGRDMKNNFVKSDNKDLGPIDPGKARIIIETNRGGRSDGGYYATSKRASEIVSEIMKNASSNSEKKLNKNIKDIIDPEEKAKDQFREQRKLTNLEMIQGVKKKERMNN